MAHVVFDSDSEKAYFLGELKRFNALRDTESAHLQADDLLLEMISDADIKAAYDVIGKWYA